MQKHTKYEQAVRTKYPEQIVIAIAKDKKGKPNPVTLGWTMIASYQPPMMAIAVAKSHYSTKAIRHSRCFTISYPSAEMAEAALFFGSVSGRDTDKFAEFPCKNKPAKKIDSVILTDAVANFECKLEGQMQAGDHIIFVGRIIACHVNTKPKKRLYSIGPNQKVGTTG